MGGMSGILTANTESELRRLARDWYHNVYDQWGMYPRVDASDFPKRFDLKEKGGEILVLNAGRDAVIFIVPLAKLKDSMYYLHLKEEAKQKKFGGIVSAHS